MHRAGVFAHTRRADRWTKAEEDELRAMAGSYTGRQIGDRIGRTKDAVHTHARVLGIYLYTDDWTMHRLARLFGADGRTITREWIKTGLIPARRLKPREHSHYGEWRIREADVEAFVLAYPWAYNPATMRLPRHPLAEMAKRVHRRDPWLSISEAASMLSIGASTLRSWCYNGVLPSKRRFVGPGAIGGHIVVRVADLEPARLEMERRRNASRFGHAA